ncbi:hypothetical protein D3C71_1978130 [compost metagenome]
MLQTPQQDGHVPGDLLKPNTGMMELLIGQCGRIASKHVTFRAGRFAGEQCEAGTLICGQE